MLKFLPTILFAISFYACSNGQFAGGGSTASKKKDSPSVSNGPDANNQTASKLAPSTIADAKSINSSEDSVNIDVPVKFEAFPGHSVDTNCVKAQFNEGEVLDLGCNRGANQFTSKSIPARTKPFCNRIRIINTNTVRNLTISTANPSQLRWGATQSLAHFLGLKIFEPVAGTLEVNLNDNGDYKEDIDVRVQISGLTSINYTVENSGQGCK